MRKLLTIACMIILLVYTGVGLAERTTLVTNWGAYSNLLEQYEKDHPEVRIKNDDSVDQLYSELINFFLTNDSRVDIFFVESQLGASQQIREKGYFADLSGEPEIVDYVNQMNPVFRRCVIKDGQIVSVPTYIMFEYVFVVNREIQAEIGLKDEELPGTLLELFRFANEWDERYSKDYPDYYPLYNSSAAMYPVEMYNPFWGLMMEKYIDSMLSVGNKLRFETPLFRALLEEIIPWNIKGNNLPEKRRKKIGQPKNSLFSVFPTSDDYLFEYLGRNILMPMPVAEGWPDVYGCKIEYAFVNPAGKQIPESIDAVKAFLDYMTPEMERVVIPSQNEPFQSPAYKTDLADLQLDIERLKSAVENETNADKKDRYEFELRMSEDILQDMIDNPFQISAEAIQEYRERIEPFVFPIGESKYDGETFYVELLDVMESLGSDGITNDVLIRKLDEMIVKLEMELGIN